MRLLNFTTDMEYIEVSQDDVKFQVGKFTIVIDRTKWFE